MSKEETTLQLEIGTQVVEAAIQRYLRGSSTGQALMLSGAWGSGKTYLLKSKLIPLAKAAKPHAFKVLYVSLNGIRTVDQLDRALFTAAYPLVRNGFVQATGVLIRGALRYASISIDDLMKVEASIDEKTLVCLDDLERVDHSLIEAVLGKVSDFLESKKAKVLVLCDEMKLIGVSAYSNGKEKVVGKTLIFAPSSEEIGRNTVSMLAVELQDTLNIASDESEELRLRIEAPLVSALKAANCRNMRLAIGATRTFMELYGDLPKDLKDRYRARIPRMLRTVAAIYIQLNERPTSQAAVERVFSMSEDDFYYLDAQNPNTAETNEFANKRLQSRDFPAVLAHEIFQFTSRGICDYVLLGQQLESLFGVSSGPDERIPPEKLLQAFRRIQQSEFDQAMKDVWAKLESKDYKTLTELNSVATILFHLLDQSLLVQPSPSASNSRPIVISGTDLLDKVLLSAQAITDRAMEDPNPSPLLDMNWATAPTNALHIRAVDNLKLLSQKIESQNWEKAKAALFRSLGTSPSQFSEDILNIEKPFSRAAVFTAVRDVDVILSELQKLTSGSEGLEGIRLVASTFRKRYLPLDMSAILQAERGVLINLSKGIEILKSRLASDQTLANSALNEISLVLKHVGAP